MDDKTKRALIDVGAARPVPRTGLLVVALPRTAWQQLLSGATGEASPRGMMRDVAKAIGDAMQGDRDEVEVSMPRPVWVWAADAFGCLSGEAGEVAARLRALVKP